MPSFGPYALTNYSVDSSNSGTLSWSNVTNAATQDGSAASAGPIIDTTPAPATQYIKGLQLSGFNPNDIGGDPTEITVTVRVRISSVSGSPLISSSEVHLVIDGAIQLEDGANDVDYTQTYADYTYTLSSTMPTVAQLQASNFGVVYSSEDNGSFPRSSTVEVDFISVTLTAPAGPTPEIDAPSNRDHVPKTANPSACTNNFNSTDCGFVGLSIGSSNATYCWGDVNLPRYHYTNYVCRDGSGNCVSSDVILNSNQATPVGFSLEGVIQFFNHPGYPSATTREHSAVTFHWDSIGKLQWFELSNYTGDIILSPLWIRDNLRDHPRDRDLLLASSSCPINPGTLPLTQLPSSDFHESSGFFARVFSLLGSYLDAQSSDYELPAGIGTTPLSSDREDSLIKNQYYQAEITQCGSDIISSLETGLTGHAREMVLEFDSTGHLKCVYFGDTDYCDEIPLLWDRDNPPPNTAGVVVPVLKLRNNCTNLADGLEIWLIHFSSIGTYIRSCLYMTLCGCTITDNRPTGDAPPCICDDRMCLVTGNCTRDFEPDFCPDTVTLPCSFQAINAANCQPIANLYCYLSYSECCAFPAGIKSSVVGSTDPNDEACLFEGSFSGCG